MIIGQTFSEHLSDKAMLGAMGDEDKDMVPDPEELIGETQTLNNYNTML